MPRILISETEQDYLRAMTIAGRLNRAAIKHRLTTYHTIPGVLAAAVALGLEREQGVFELPGPAPDTTAQELIAALAGGETERAA